MSMGYNDDDPRREGTLAKLRAGVYRLPEGGRPTIHRDQRRAGAKPPSAFGAGPRGPFT